MNTAVMPCEQLEERLAALHRACLELVQDLSLESLLGRIASIACEQAGAHDAAVGVFAADGSLEQFIPVEMSHSQVRRSEDPPLDADLLVNLAQSQGSLRIRDLSEDPRTADFPAKPLHGVSYLGVPIRQGEHLLGQIYLTDKLDNKPFSEEDQQVIEMLSGYAAAAITNARLYHQLTEQEQNLSRREAEHSWRSEDLTLLSDLAVVLASSSDLDQILEYAFSRVMEHLHLASGAIFLRQGNSRVIKRVFQRHADHCDKALETQWESPQYQMGEGIVGEVAQSGQLRLLDQIPGKESCQSACAPLTGRLGIQGVLCVAASDPKALDERGQQFLATIGSWLGIAIEKLRLDIQQRRLAVLEERERIGMDLHDGIIQSIYAVGLTLEHAQLLLKENSPQADERIQQSIQDLNNTIRDIRAYILDLRPRQLYDEDLIQGVHRLVSEFRANTLVEVNLKSSSDGITRLPQAQAIALFHICQEALANIAKHAQARRVNITLWTTSDRALLEVEDDGRGFDQERVKFTLGHGLSNMQTRAHNAGGDVEISSGPGNGATILAWVPLT